MSESFWTLERFGDHLERWIDLEQPAPELRKVVIDWTFAHFDNPYAAGLRRDRDQPNFYWGGIPGTVHGEHQVVTCGFWIYEHTRSVICYGYASLSLPCRARWRPATAEQRPAPDRRTRRLSRRAGATRLKRWEIGPKCSEGCLFPFQATGVSVLVLP